MLLRIIRWFTIFYVIVLTLLLELPVAPTVSSIEQSTRGYAHLIIFALLGFLVELCRRKRSLFFWICVLCLYAVGTEVLQWLLRSICHREFDWIDVSQDVVGVLLGTLIGYFCRPLVQRLSESLDKKE